MMLHNKLEKNRLPQRLFWFSQRSHERPFILDAQRTRLATQTCRASRRFPLFLNGKFCPYVIKSPHRWWCHTEHFVRHSEVKQKWCPMYMCQRTTWLCSKWCTGFHPPSATIPSHSILQAALLFICYCGSSSAMVFSVLGVAQWKCTILLRKS